LKGGWGIGVAGAGGVLFCPGGITELVYSWSLGQATNNQAEAYTLLQGLVLVKACNIGKLFILGDSKNTINHLRWVLLPRDAKLRSIFYRIHKELKAFQMTNSTFLESIIVKLTDKPIWPLQEARESFVSTSSQLTTQSHDQPTFGQ
jgi:ribonuclease HI